MTTEREGADQPSHSPSEGDFSTIATALPPPPIDIPAVRSRIEGAEGDGPVHPPRNVRGHHPATAPVRPPRPRSRPDRSQPAAGIAPGSPGLPERDGAAGGPACA